MQLLLSFIVALAVTVILMPPMIRSAARFDFIDVPDARKLHSDAIPRVGGMAMAVGTALAIVVWRGESPELTAILFGILVILFFGAWDDRADLDFRVKFLGQLVAALVVVYAGDVVIERVPFWDQEPLPRYIAVPFTVFALLGITNAVNLSDGLDGLAGGTMLLSFGALALLAFMAGGDAVVIIALAAMGSILGFLRFNTHPARAFMGDAGSQFLGFTAGVLAIVLTQKVHPALSSVLPLYLLGVPIVDTLVVMARRIRERRSPFSPDKNHVHHKLLYLGFDHYEAVLIIYMAQALLVAAGYFFRYQSDAVLLVAYCLFCAAVLITFRGATSSGWRFKGRAVGEAGVFISGRVNWLREEGRVTRWVFGYVLACVIAYLLLATVFGDRVSRDVGAMALVLLVVMLAMYLGRRGEPFNMPERAGLYTLSALAVYLAQAPLAALSWLGVCEKAFFVLLAIAVIVAVLYCWKDRFELTTLDFLVLFLALMVPFVPSEYFYPWDERFVLLKLIVLFYGIELLLYRFSSHVDVMRFATMVGFATVGVKGLLSV